MRPTNCFYNGCRGTWYFRHPIKALAYLGKNCYSAYMRVTRGWCYMDVWNMSDWVLDMWPEMLEHLAEKGCAYPGTDEFPTPESWKNWLREQANLLRSAREEEQDARNPYAEEFFSNPKDDVIRKKFWDTHLRIAEEARTNLETAMGNIARHFWMLWD